MPGFSSFRRPIPNKRRVHVPPPDIDPSVAEFLRDAEARLLPLYPEPTQGPCELEFIFEPPKADNPWKPTDRASAYTSSPTDTARYCRVSGCPGFALPGYEVCDLHRMESGGMQEMF